MSRIRFTARAARLAAAAGAVVLLSVPATSSAGTFDSLAGWWPMFEGRGQIVHDWSGNGNHGQLGAEPTADEHDPTWIRGFLFGSALRFDGNDFVRIPDSPALEPQQLTLSMWVRSGSSPGFYRYIAGKGASGCTSSSYALTTTFNGGLQFYIWDGSHQRSSGLVDPSAIWNGRWHHIAGTWDGAAAKLFVDGQEIDRGSLVQEPIEYDLPTTGDTGIGGYLGTCDLYYTGDVDQVAVFSQALPVSDIYKKVAAFFPRPRR